MIKFLIITALPVAFLIYYLYRQDRWKPEPKEKLLTSFALGMGGGIAGAVVVEIFALLGIGSGYESLFYSDVLAGAVSAAVMVCVVYLILWKYSEKNPDFDEFFDGPVYATCIAFGYQVMCDFFNMRTDEWVDVGLISIMVIVALYGSALYIGYFYALAHFGKLEMTRSNKFKMWLYPFLFIWIYNVLIYWYNTTIVGTVAGLAAFACMAVFIYKKNGELLAELKALDAERSAEVQEAESAPAPAPAPAPAAEPESAPADDNESAPAAEPESSPEPEEPHE